MHESVRDAALGVEMEVDQQLPTEKPTAREPTTEDLLGVILQMQL